MTCEEIKEIVENYTGLDITTKSNKQQYTNARAIFNYCARRYANEYVGYERLGELTNCRHATVMNSILRFYNYVETEPEFRSLTSQIVDAILEIKAANPDPEHEIDDLDYTTLRQRYYKSKKVIKNQYAHFYNKCNNLQKEVNRLKRMNKKLEKICNLELID